MKSTARLGIWEEEIAPGVTMICDTTHNRILIQNIHGSNLRYDFNDEEIRISDVERIKNGILRTCKFDAFMTLAD